MAIDALVRIFQGSHSIGGGDKLSWGGIPEAFELRRGSAVQGGGEHIVAFL